MLRARLAVAVVRAGAAFLRPVARVSVLVGRVLVILRVEQRFSERRAEGPVVNRRFAQGGLVVASILLRYFLAMFAT